ncbi:hypothetical protein GCM10020258_57800 [Sphingomonas yabuuchiae]
MELHRGLCLARAGEPWIGRDAIDGPVQKDLRQFFALALSRTRVAVLTFPDSRLSVDQRSAAGGRMLRAGGVF